MENPDKDVYFADYMDYSIKNSGRNIVLPFEQLSFDLLCFFPSKTVLTLTSTLIGESSTKFTEFHDFWKGNILKIHLSEGDTADKYLSRKLASSWNINEDDYEMNLYSSNGASFFINNYLKAELSNNNINYVLSRVSNADVNNRKAFLANLAKYEREIIESSHQLISLRNFDRLELRLEYLANDFNFVFQRSHIIHDLVDCKIFKSSSAIPNVLLSIFDTSYNQAMARSINGIIISTMSKQLNGKGLRNFLKGYSPNLYNSIKSMSPKQVFLLAQDRNWQIYRKYISDLFVSLSSNDVITQDSPFYKKTIKAEIKDALIGHCLDMMADAAFDKLKYLNPGFYIEIQNVKSSISDCFNYLKGKYSKQEEYYSEEIVKRSKFIEQICADILNDIYG